MIENGNQVLSVLFIRLICPGPVQRLICPGPVSRPTDNGSTGQCSDSEGGVADGGGGVADGGGRRSGR